MSQTNIKKAYQFKGLLQNKKWLMPAFVHLDDAGTILSVEKKAKKEVVYEKINGFALPGMQNAHSHAFQYAMVGLTEQHAIGKEADDFWSWRKAMYQLALTVSPKQMEAIATMLYAEMLRHGYTQVAEFHYVHHQPSGKAYANVAELGERLIAAAQKVGIKITLVPIFYQKGGFGKAATDGQRRFISKDLAIYLDLFEASKKACKHYADAQIADGVHSMRAVEPAIIKKMSQQVAKDLPFHIHVSEQLKEVAASIEYLGKRPVEWLSEEIELSPNYHLVHATHLNSKEIKALAKSQANVVLCPSTEGNLGDGFFPLNTYQALGGNWSIGTDSHIGLNPFEELRILDYGQRLGSHKRNTFVSEVLGNSGLYALEKLILNGRKAMGNSNKVYFKKGEPFDALIMDAKVPILQVCAKENLTSTIVYATDVSMHLGTIVNGEWKVKKGKHSKAKSIKKQFIKALKSLNNR
jgi:formimidoylglutamate deiminase